MKLRDSVWSLMITPAAGWCGQGTCEASDMRLGHEERTQRERMKWPGENEDLAACDHNEMEQKTEEV